MELSVASGIVANMMKLFTENGEGMDDLLRLTRIDPNELLHPDGHIPLRQVNALWSAMAVKSGDPEIGLHIGERYNISILGLTGLLVQNSLTVRQAMEMACHYSNLLSNSMSVLLKQEGSSFRLEFSMDPLCWLEYPESAKHALISFMVYGHKELQYLTGHKASAEEIAVMSDTQCPEEYLRVFDTLPRFNAQENYLSYPIEILDLPVLASDYKLLLELEKVAVQRLQQLDAAHKSLALRVRRLMYTLMNPALPTLQDIAGQLYLSPRSLQRRLKEEGTSFADIREEVKMSLARHYLEKGLNMSETAFLLGYSELSAFSRKYKQWQQ